MLFLFLFRNYRDEYLGYVGSRYWGDEEDRSNARPQRNEMDKSGDRRSQRWEGDKRFDRSTRDKNLKESDDANDKHKAELKRKKEEDPVSTKTGGAYIPPAKLRMMQAQITDKSSIAYQRLAWEALKKSIHGLINKVNISNIPLIIKSLIKENIIRGRGLLSRSIIQAQAASPTFTHVYAALVAIINSKVHFH